MEKKYIVLGGNVYSVVDNDWHYVNAHSLANLYGVNPQECYLLETNHAEWRSALKGLPPLPHLQVRRDGRYLEALSDKAFDDFHSELNVGDRVIYAQVSNHTPTLQKAKIIEIKRVPDLNTYHYPLGEHKVRLQVEPGCGGPEKPVWVQVDRVAKI